MSIRVIAQSNPFKAKRDEEVFEQGISLNSILEELKIDSEEHPVRISINGEPELDFDAIPDHDSLVLIKVIPTGQEQVGQTLLGGAIIALGVLVTIGTLGGGTAFGVGLIAMGAGIIFQDEIQEGINAYVEDALGVGAGQDYANPNTTATNYLSGGRNGFKQDGVVPVILGRHRYYPYQVALPYRDLVNTYSSFAIDNAPGVIQTRAKPFTQNLHQVYLWGHKEVIPDPTTYKRGDTFIGDLTGTEYASNSLPYYGTKAKKFLNIGKVLKKYVRDVTNNNNGFTLIKVILPSNITEANPTIVFGNFFAFGEGGSKGFAIARVEIGLYEVSTNTQISLQEYYIWSAYMGPDDESSPSSSTIPLPTLPDVNKQYYMTVRRLNDDPKDNINEGNRPSDSVLYASPIENWAVDCILSHVLCTGNSNTITASAQATFNYSDLVLTDTDKDPVSGESILTGEINDFNAIVQTHVRTYSGSGSGSGAWTNNTPSSNPASMFLYVLQGSPNKRPVPDTLIDWEALEEWYEFCESESFECNLVLENPGTIENILNTICNTGRAALNMTDLYSVIVDKPRLAPTQMFTNKNSFGMTSSRTLSNDVHAIEYTFINEDADYQTDKGWEYKDGYNAGNATLKQSQSVVGMTNSNQVSSMMKYRLNTAERRTETLSVSMDVEYVLCQRGDLVTVAYDELLQGLAKGRVREVVKIASDVTELVLDELVTLESGKTYAIIVRVSDGVQTVAIPVVNTLNTTDTLILVTPAPFPIEVGNLYTFGEATKEKEDYIVLSISPNKDLTATVSLMNYAPEVYTLGTLTPFTSQVSLPAGFGPSLILDNVYDLDDVAVQTQVNIDQINGVVTPSLKDAIRGSTPSATFIRDDILELKLSNNFLYFVDRTDLKLYRTTTLVGAGRTLIIDEPVKNFAIDLDDLYIVYSSILNGNKLYKKDLDTLVVTAVTTVIGTQPAISGADQIIYINNSDENKVYLTSTLDDTTGELVSDFPTTSIDITASFLTWMDAETGFIYIKNIYDNDLTYRGDVFRELASTNVIASPPGLWQVNNANAVPVYVDSNSQISYANLVAYYGEVSRHALDIRGNYVFVTFDGSVYFVSLFGDYDTQARLSVEVITQGFGVDIICSTTSGSDRLTNIAIVDIDKFSVGDTLSGTGIPVGTKVTIVGSGYVIMDNSATVTNISASINVAGEVQCALVEFDTKVRNISVQDIIQFSWDDDISGVGIQDGTKVKFVGVDYIIMSQTSLITDPTATINVFGTRLLLDANKVVITGSIQARLLETNAINSIDRVPAGAPENVGQQLYQHDLSNGIEERYDENGKLFMKVTPDNGLELSDGISIGGTIVPEDPSFTDTTYTTFRQPTEPVSGMIEGDQWYDTDSGLFYTFTGSAWEIISYTTAQLDDLGIDAGTINDGKTVAVSVPVGAEFTDTTNTIYRQTTAPTSGLIDNDQWFDTDDNLLYSRVGGSWDLIGPASLGDLDGNADTKLNNIDEGATQNNFYTVATVANLPTVGNTTGDLGIVTDVDDLYKWTGSAWIKISDATPGYLNNGGAVGFTGTSSWGIDGNGKLTASGATINGDGTFSGDLSAVGGTFTGDLSAVGGTFTGQVEVISADLLTRTVVDEGDITFYTRTISTDPWTPIGTLAGGYDGTIPVLLAPQDFRIGDMTVGRGGGNISTNVALGVNSLGSISTTGSNNVGIGTSALTNATTGSNNVGIGTSALGFNTTGDNNVGIGIGAVSFNISGDNNVGIGVNALAFNNTGYDNVAIGTVSLKANTTGHDNIALGERALENNTLGINNIALGLGAMGLQTTVNNNIGIGVSALASATAGQNVAIGFNALASTNTGQYNTAIGYRAGFGVTTGFYNTALGRNSLDSITTYSNTTGVGYESQVTGSNQVQLGDSSTTTYAYGSVQNRSDARDKSDVVETDLGLEFILNLNPVKFRWDYREDYKEVDEATGEKTQNPSDGSKKRNRYHQGFIAQEVKSVMDNMHIDFAGYQDHLLSGGEDVKSLGYAEFIAPMVKALQEQHKLIEDLTIRLNNLG